MKTAIIKTGFWQDDDVQVMNADTKLVYLCLLTNPQRDTLPVFRVGDSMLSAYTGFNKDLINTCRKQLIEAGRILYKEVDGKWYYIFTTQDFVVPSRGHTAQAIYEREFAKLPVEIQDFVNEIYGVNTTGGTTGASTSVNTNTNTKHNTNTKAITNTVPERALELAQLLAALHIENLRELNWKIPDIDKAQINKWAASIELLNRKDGYEYEMIEAVLRWSQKDDFWKTNIRSGPKLKEKFTTLLLQAKVDFDKNSNRVIVAGQE